ncbi:MAG: hypothetical protein MR828_04520 [Clostridiales bacterium]|nr:hypothetical protein [Clostridiales bacterium]
MNEMTAKKLAEVMNDVEANEKLECASGIEEITAILNEYGVEITAAELEEIVVKSSGEELSLESLDEVAGGGWFKKTWKSIKGHISSALNGLFDGFLGGYSN